MPKSMCFKFVETPTIYPKELLVRSTPTSPDFRSRPPLLLLRSLSPSQNHQGEHKSATSWGRYCPASRLDAVSSERVSSGAPMSAETLDHYFLGHFRAYLNEVNENVFRPNSSFFFDQARQGPSGCVFHDEDKMILNLELTTEPDNEWMSESEKNPAFVWNRNE